MGTTPTDDRTRLRARAVVVVCTLLVLVAAVSVSTASAYWSGSIGGGSGSGRSATPQPVVLAPAIPSAQLYPGGLGGVSLSVTNPNTVSLRIGTLSLDTTQGRSGFDADAAHAACDPSALSFTAQTNGGSGWTVPASGSLSITLPGSLSMGTGADSACQGAQLTVYLRTTS